jgi:hypothetical protein
MLPGIGRGVQSQVSLHGKKVWGAWPHSMQGISCERWRPEFSTVSHMALLLPVSISTSTLWPVTFVRMVEGRERYLRFDPIAPEISSA